MAVTAPTGPRSASNSNGQVMDLREAAAMGPPVNSKPYTLGRAFQNKQKKFQYTLAGRKSSCGKLHISE